MIFNAVWPSAASVGQAQASMRLSRNTKGTLAT